MALSLQDFNKPSDTQELRMNAFQPKISPSPAANKATINTLATYGAALSPDGNVDSAYQSITNQLGYSTSSSTLDLILNQWNTNDVEGSMNTLKDVLVDPNINDEKKTAILHGFQTGQSQNSLPYKVAISSAIADSEGENGEQEDLRVRIAQGFNDVDNYNAWAQKSINALNSQNDPNWQTNVKSMVESLIPFTDAARSTIFQQIVDVKGTGELGDAVRSLLLLGEGREELRATLARIPIEDRQPIVQNIINVIKSSGGSLSNNLTTLKQVEELERMIVPGAYNNTDRWADNIFSVMDDTILLTPFSKGLKALGAGLKGLDGARVAEETIARADRAVEAPLMIEYKPSPISYGDDIDRMVDNLPIEPTSAQIKELREATMTEIGNPNGFSIDNVIDRMSMTDSMTSSQIIDVRQNLGAIRDKRSADLNGNLAIPEVPRISTEDVINSLPVEPTKAEIDDIRNLINSNATNDDIINNALIVDKMTAPQIADLRSNLANVELADSRKVVISSNVQPTSVAEIYKHTNPSKARIAHNAVVADESGNAARILYGTDRDSVIGNDFLPEIGGNGRVRNKLEYDEATATPDTSILKKVKESDGAIWADKVEKQEASNRIIKDWKNTIGITNRSAMNSLQDLKPSIDETGSGVSFNQVFGPKEGGFSSAFTAVDTVKASLRKYGVDDKDITLLARGPDGNYAPANPKMDLQNGDFLVQVKHDYSFDPKDIGYTGFDISPLWGFIKIPDINIPKINLNQGGVLQQVIPKAVNVDIRAYGAGVSAADKSAGLEKQLLQYGKQVADKWKKLSKPQQKLVDDYIRLANDQEITFNSGKIRARGISEEGLSLLVDWKAVQDTVWSLENVDVNRTLRQRGYEYFVHRGSDTKLIVEPQPRASNVYGTRYYEADTGKVRTMTNDELDKLYAEGGSTGKLRQPETFQGEEVSFVIAKNNADGGYNRRIRDDDDTLSYRDGYYHVRYTDPYFITKYDPKTKSTKTIARAESRRDAEVEARRLSDTKDGYEYDWKHDRYSTPDSAFDDNLSVQFSSGRSSQRLRGKRLDRVGSDKTIGDSGLESPIESLTRSISSVATRTSFRNVLEADKRRWTSQFKHLLPPGPPKFPSDINEIRAGQGANEARHAHRYITGLQDGYANLLDDASKGFFNKVSDVAGGKGWDWVDKVARKAATKSPSTAARLTAFRLFLASNPIGQFPLQAIPALPIISSTNPLGWGKVIQQAGILGAFHRGVDVSTTMKVGKFTGLSVDEMKALVKDYELSGMSAAVNAHSYLSNDLGRLADRNIVQKGLSILGKPLRVTQSIGFDFGEQTLMSLVWLSNRDRMLRRLKKTSLNASELEELTVQTRAMTGDMNKGGEMPYNSNTFSTIMQFLQSPHKIASGLVLGHKGLTVADRAKLAAGYTLAFGVPPVLMVDQFINKILPPDNPEAREIIKGGLTNIIFNKFLSSLSGEQVAVDFAGRLQPFSTEPLTEFIGGLFTTSIPEMISGSAAPSLVSEGGRIGEFVKAVLAPFTPGEYEGVDEYKQIGLTFMQMFTGVSNTMKAQYMLELGKITTRSGQVVDDDISFMEAMMKAAGFSTIDEVRYWEANKKQWEISDGIDNDIKTLVDGLFVKYTREGGDVSDTQSYINVMREASRVFHNNPMYMEKIADYYQFKTRQDPDALYRTLFRNSGLYSADDAVQIINNSNFSQEQIDTLMEMYNIAGESYGN